MTNITHPTQKQEAIVKVKPLCEVCEEYPCECPVVLREPEIYEPEADECFKLSNEKKRLECYYVDLLYFPKSQDIINNTLKFFVKQAHSNKNGFLGLSIFVMLLNLAVLVINEFRWTNGLVSDKSIITILTALATFFTALTTFIGFLKEWTRYRNSAESLKSECNLFHSKTGDYKGLGRKEREQKLIENFESINRESMLSWSKTKEEQISQENKNTQGVDSKEKKSKPPKPPEE